MKSKIESEFNDYYQRIATKPRGNNRGHYSEVSFSQLRATKDVKTLSIEQVVAKSILDFESDNGKFYSPIRVDAKVLLIINFADMIYYPLTRTGGQNRAELKFTIYKEVQEILKEASNESKEITSHTILKTGLNLWNRLKTTAGDSW